MRNLLRLGAVLALSLPLLVATGPQALADNATLTISDTGFSPPTLTINRGDTVTFTNSGAKVHTATTKTAPVPFDTGGLTTGQMLPINFTVAGTYEFTSAIDCINSGGQGSGFNCSSMGVIQVVDSTQAYNGNAFPTPSPTNTPLPNIGPPQSVTINITKSGFDPPVATVALGGSVTWVNMDNTATHTVTTTGGGNAQTFDSGGLGPGLSSSVTFAIQGAYTYTSATDCLNGNKTSFSCATYQIVVSGQQSVLAPAPAAGASGATGGAAVAGTAVTIDDVNGFNPPVLAIHPGQTVTWTNNGTQVHTVVSNPGYPGQFDSGGLGPGQKFSFTFPSPGSYGYHSTTEVAYAIDGMGNQVPQFKFNATVIAQ
jgi:plastocyanin